MSERPDGGRKKDFRKTQILLAAGTPNRAAAELFEAEQEKNKKAPGFPEA